MLQHRGEGVGAEGCDAEGIVGVGRQSGHSIRGIAPYQPATMQHCVAVSDALYRPRSVPIAGIPLQFNCV